MRNPVLSACALAAMVLASVAADLAAVSAADARPGAWGGGVRAAPTSIARGGNRTAVARNSGNRVNTGNVHVGNNNVNVNVNGGGGCCGWYGHDYHPVATAAAVGVVAGTTAAITSAALGARYYALPPACSPYLTSYYYCGGVYYEPQYQGDKVVYVVVNRPG